jgi:hypothetical protein
LQTKETMMEVDSIQKSLQHRSFNSGSGQKFEAKLKAKIAKMVSQYSFMKFYMLKRDFYRFNRKGTFFLSFVILKNQMRLQLLTALV